MLTGSQPRTTVCENCLSRLQPDELCSYCRDNPSSDVAQGDVLRPGNILKRYGEPKGVAESPGRA